MKPLKLINFLLFGSVLLPCLMLLGCHSIIDYAVRAEWIYINQSSHNISIKRNSEWPLIFTIESGKQHKIERLGDGPKVMNLENYVTTPFGYANITIKIDDATEIELPWPKSILSLSNYTPERIDERHWRFTYVFTDENIAELTKPEEPAEPAEPAAVDK